ncbi:protein FAM13A isoform X2 [Battus philenor]|uniref:protein FAM13A isoform X2 n=1 Tax=Battus philenor TaxID=42288 RepID=UPI0035CF86D2
MVLLDINQGYGHRECPSERRVVISGLGWRAQCCERDRVGEETEDMAAPECEREARKRRERHDSGCAHERKERRPHSEERYPPPPPPPPPLHDHNRLESERRAERLSRARRPQFGGKRRRPPTRISKQPKQSDYISSDESRCDSPPHFEYLITQKPELSPESEHVEISNRQEEAEHVRRDERSAAPRRAPPCPDRRLEKINKKINVLKKSIAKYESEFEVQNGHAITPGERITDVQLTRMHESLRKLQEEKRCIKTDPIEYALKVQAAKQQKERDKRLDAALNSDKPMTDLVRDIEEGCREADGRGAVPEARWSCAQLAAEKLCVQRVLLKLEAARGRPPVHSADRGAARHLYERYRAVKRALAASRNDASLGGTNGELATIHEHETIVFNNSIDSSSDSQERPTDSSQETTETPLQSPPTREILEELPSSTSSAQSGASDDFVPTNEGLHYLGLHDLKRALVEAKLHKCVVRRNIKEYEVNFELVNNRKIQKDDLKEREEEYIQYKTIKARIKLLNALINKQKSKL